VFGFQDEIRDNTRTNSESPGPGHPICPTGKKPLARWKLVPVYRWCWVTLGEQSRVISRLFRNFDALGIKRVIDKMF
jgi:hypothetical protein